MGGYKSLVQSPPMYQIDIKSNQSSVWDVRKIEVKKYTIWQSHLLPLTSTLFPPSVSGCFLRPRD